MDKGKLLYVQAVAFLQDVTNLLCIYECKQTLNFMKEHYMRLDQMKARRMGESGHCCKENRKIYPSDLRVT